MAGNDYANKVDIKHHIEMLLEAQEKRFNDKFGSMEKDVVLARDDVSRRLAELNNLRKEVMEDRGQFVRRDVWDGWKESVEKRLNVAETRTITWTAAIGLFFVIIGIILRFLKV